MITLKVFAASLPVEYPAEFEADMARKHAEACKVRPWASPKKPAAPKETDIMKLAMIELSKRGHVVFRANVGLFYTKDGRPARTGLPVGFPDTFGARPDGQFFAIEFKMPGGRLRKEQRTTLNALRARGLRAGVAYSVEDAIRIAEGDAVLTSL